MKTYAPGPKGHPITGVLGDFRRDTLGMLIKAQRDYGDIVRLRIGPITTHLINSPALIEDVLLRGAEDYDKNTRSAQRVEETCGKSLLSGDHQAWRRHRRLVQPAFQPARMVGTDALVDREIAPFLEHWHRLAVQGTPIDILPEMNRLTITISAKLLFGSVVDSCAIEQALDVLLKDTWRRIETLVDPSLISGLFHRADFKKARAQIDAIVLDLIALRRDADPRPDDLLSRLIDAHETEGGAALTDQELRDAAVTLLLSGHETTATALAWALYLMGTHPHAGPDQVGAKNFLAETLRLYPSIWVIERRAIHATTLGGYQIAKGSGLLISPYILHRSPDHWPEPERFDPNRFLPEMIVERPRHAYLPFGLGQHRCVGIYMAQTVAQRVIEHINARFRLSSMGADIPQLDPGLTLRHKRSFKMRFTPR